MFLLGALSVTAIQMQTHKTKSRKMINLDLSHQQQIVNYIFMLRFYGPAQ